MQSIRFCGKFKTKTLEMSNRLWNLAENSDLQFHTNKNDELIMMKLFLQITQQVMSQMKTQTKMDGEN